MSNYLETEFSLAVSLYIKGIVERPRRSSTASLTAKDERKPPIETVAAPSAGEALTSLGPAEYPASGCILDYPDLLWTEDKWTEDRYREAEERLRRQGACLPSHWHDVYSEKGAKYWTLFYRRNQTNFYKDRHYLHIVFPELLQRSTVEHPVSTFDPSTYVDSTDISAAGSTTASTAASATVSEATNTQFAPLRLLEVGCGVGNAVLPLMDVNPSLHVTAVDFASSAIELLRQNPVVLASQRIFPHCCDVVNDPLPVPDQSQDLVLCMFVLSAVAPKYHRRVLSKLLRALKPGGKLLLRDYGRYDEAQLRFGKGSKLDENFYVRQDGTCAYYFDKNEIGQLMRESLQWCAHTETTVDSSVVPVKEASVNDNCEIDVEENDYILRQYANRQQQVARYRVWIHAKVCKRPKADVRETAESHQSLQDDRVIGSVN